jgi:prophage regulatory protein
MERKFYFAEQCEELTGLLESTFRYWASVGKGPTSFLLGRRRVWPVDDFHKWLNEQRQAQQAGA